MAKASVTKVFGEVIRQRRLKAGLSQEALAFHAKTQQGYISFIERGLRSPSLTTVSLLAQALGTSMRALVGEVEDRMKAG